MCPHLAPALKLARTALQCGHMPHVPRVRATSEVNFNARADLVLGVAAPMQQARRQKHENGQQLVFQTSFTMRNGQFSGFSVIYTDFAKNQTCSHASFYSPFFPLRCLSTFQQTNIDVENLAVM